MLPSQDYSHLALDLAADDFAAFTEKLRDAGVREWQQNSSEGHSVYFLDPDGNKLEAHSGSLQTRLNSLKDNPYSGLVWL